MPRSPSAYRYRDPNREHHQVRQGLAFQYRMLASNEVQTVCTHYETDQFWVDPMCTTFGENDYIRRAHQFQLVTPRVAGTWGRMQVDLMIAESSTTTCAPGIRPRRIGKLRVLAQL